MNRLIRLYPRQWRDRYGEELDALVADLVAEPHGRSYAARLRLTLDLARGALDAQLSRRYPMRRLLADPALRRGCYDGLLIAAVLAVLVVLTNVVFPPGPTESDSDPEYIWQLLATYALIALAFVAIGARGARRTASVAGGFRAGAAAGLIVAALVTLEFVAVNNVFFGIVSHQHDKVLAFQASGWSSMRAFVTVRQLLGALVVVPFGTLVGGGLGLLGGALVRRLRAARA